LRLAKLDNPKVPVQLRESLVLSRTLGGERRDGAETSKFLGR
jgi:hypothetical protein